MTGLFRDIPAGECKIGLMRILLQTCLIALIASCLFPGITMAEPSPELRTLIEKYGEAIGGMRTWSKVESIQLSGTVERDGKQVDLVMIKKRPNQIRATITLPLPSDDENKLQVIRAHDGKTAWTATRLAGAETMTKEELSPSAAAELLADAGTLPRLIQLWRAGVDIELRESSEIDGQPAFTITAQGEDGTTHATFYLSSEDFLLLAFESHDPVNGTTRTTLSDYETYSGIQLPTRRIIDSGQTGRSVITTRSVEVGVGIYKDYFRFDAPLKTARSD